MAIITFKAADGTESVVEWTGTYTHPSGFTIERDLISARELGELGDKGLTHLLGNVCTSIFSAGLKKGKYSLADRERVINEERVRHREMLYADEWALGTRARVPGENRLEVLYWQDLHTEVRRICNENFQKGEAKDTWFDAGVNEWRDIKSWAESYRDNPAPVDGHEPVVETAEDGTVTEKPYTLGMQRHERHMANAVRKLEEETRNRNERVETRKIAGTMI